MATPATVRKINGSAALTLLWREGPMSRAELARRLGLTKASVTDITARFEESGYLQTGNAILAGKVGRPGAIVSIRPEAAYFIGIEIGVDRMNAVAMDLGGNIASHFETHGAFSEMPQADVLDALAKLHSRTVTALENGTLRVRDTRISVPGYVRDDGFLIDAKILGWGGIPLGHILSERLGLSVGVENDANAAAFAEWYLDEELRSTSMYLMLLEAGIGGACIMGGELAVGRHGLAGEIGHARFMLGDRENGVSPRGKALQDLIGKGALMSSLNKRGVACTEIAEVLTSLETGNEAAVHVVENWASTVAAALSFVALSYDVEYIVLSGELAELFDHSSPTLNRELEAILPSGFPPPTLRKAQFTGEGGAVGAAAMGHAAFFGAMETSAGALP